MRRDLQRFASAAIRRCGLWMAVAVVMPAAAGLLSFPRLQAQDVSTEEQAPPSYMGRQIAATMHYSGAPWLMRESRQSEEDCNRLLKALKIKPGQTVCDMGCGNGFYTICNWPGWSASGAACWPSTFSPRCSACSTSRSKVKRSKTSSRS